MVSNKMKLKLKKTFLNIINNILLREGYKISRVASNQSLILLAKTSSTEINFVMSSLKINQKKLSKEFEVSQAAISQAISGDPLLKKLRGKIIDYLNTLQFNGNGIANGK
jgi:hypothetical protein